MGYRYDLTIDGFAVLELDEDGEVWFDGQCSDGSVVEHRQIGADRIDEVYWTLRLTLDDDVDHCIETRTLTHFAVTLMNLLRDHYNKDAPIAPHIIAAALVCGLDAPAIGDVA